MCVDSVLTNETAKPKLNHIETARGTVWNSSPPSCPLKAVWAKNWDSWLFWLEITTGDVLHWCPAQTIINSESAPQSSFLVPLIVLQHSFISVVKKNFGVVSYRIWFDVNKRLIINNKRQAQKNPGSFPHSANLLSCHGDVTHGGPGISVCDRFVYLPQHCIPYDSPLEQGC